MNQIVINWTPESKFTWQIEQLHVSEDGEIKAVNIAYSQYSFDIEFDAVANAQDYAHDNGISIDDIGVSY